MSGPDTEPDTRSAQAQPEGLGTATLSLQWYNFWPIKNVNDL
jgi:hypothetical protein